MSDFTKYLPSDEEISKAFEHDYYDCQCPDAKEYCPELKRLILAAVERAVADEMARYAREIEQLRQHVSLAALYLSRLTNCSKCMTKIEHPDEIHRIGNYITAALAALDGEVGEGESS